MAPFAWSLLYRSLNRSEALGAETQLLEKALGAGRWRSAETTVSAAADDTVHSVAVDGRGRGDLVLVHGLGTGGGIFFRNIAPLATAFGTVHAVDWRGAGLSGRPAFEASTHDEARDFLVDGLEAWRAAQGIERMTLFGHSMGGIVAAHFADRYPERIDHLVLCGPASVEARPRRFEPGESRLYDLAERLWIGGFTPSQFIRALGPWGKRLVEAYAGRRFKLDDEDAEQLGEYIHAVNALRGSSEQAMNKLLAPIAQPRMPIAPIVEAIPKAVPVTYIYGESDWMNPASGDHSAARRRAAGGDGECIILPKGGHYIFIDQPDAFVKALLGRVKP